MTDPDTPIAQLVDGFATIAGQPIPYAQLPPRLRLHADRYTHWYTLAHHTPDTLAVEPKVGPSAVNAILAAARAAVTAATAPPATTPTERAQRVLDQFDADTRTLLTGRVLPLDPLGRTDKPPVFMSKVGFDCTIPVVGDYDLESFMACTITEPLGAVPPDVTPLSEEELTRRMEAFIQAAPRTWLEILKAFHGQPNPLLYRAFGNLRGKLGRVADRRPEYPYTFADTWFVYEKGQDGK